MLTSLRAPSLVYDERGATLIETLVAAVCGVIVAGALFAILIVSLHQSSRITDTVQATQRGRTAMSAIVDELHSTCISRGFAPVQTGSGATKLLFIDSYGEESVPTKAQQDEIVWTKEAGKESGTLTDNTYLSKGGEWPKFTFAYPGAPSSTYLLARNVSKTGSTPIFQYYKYAPEAKSSSESALGTLTAVGPPAEGFTSAEAGTVASVLVSFTTAPAVSHSSTAGRSVALSNQTTFAFGSPASESTIKAGPCE
jgi:Tfp pilus assembly protein PilW